MTGKSRPLSFGLVLVAALLFFGVMGCSLSDLLPAPPGGPEIQFWASPDVVPPGGCSLLRWDVSGAEEYPVFFDGREVPPSGDEEVCLDRTETFELVVGAPGGSVRETVTVRVEGEPGEPPPEEAPPEEPPPAEPPPEEPPHEGGPEALVLLVDPDAIPQGGCAMLHWEVHPPEFSVFVNGQEVPPIGEREECPQQTATYELEVDAPGGPHRRTVTLNVEAGPGPEPPPPPAATATQPPPAQPTATQPPPAQPTATTFVPRWGQCSWVQVHPAINSHQPKTWCSNGSFLTGLDLDREGSYDAMDSPVVGQAHCCPLSVAQFSPWGQCSWVKYGNSGAESHQAKPLCPNGQFLTGLDLDRYGGADPLDSPVIGQGFCCPLGDPKYSGWGSCSWVKVEQGGINSHQPVTWCPNGSFLAGIDLDRIAADAMDSPGVGQAYCCTPK